MAENLNIQVSVDVKKAKDLESLKNEVKKLDISLKNASISFSDASKAAQDLANKAKTLGLAEKDLLQVQNQLVNINNRSVSGFRNMGKSLHDLTQSSNRSQQAFVALAYIIQDLPYGIRGVANNITQLSQVLGTPIGINLGISALTSLMVVMGNAEKEAKKLKDVLDEIWKTRGGIAMDAYSLGLMSESEYRKLLEGRSSAARKKLYEAIPGAGALGLTDKDLLKPIDSIIKNNLGGMEMSIEKTEELVKLQEEYVNSLVKIAQFEKILFDERKSRAKELDSMFINQMKFLVSKREFDAATFIGAGGVQAYDLQNGKPKEDFRSGVPLRGVKVLDIKSSQEYSDEWMREQLQDSVNTFNSVFFDPVRAGFRAISDEIRQGLFGSLDDLKAKFGNVGAAIVQSLTQVITKLIEVGLSAAILSFLFPGAGGFVNIFKAMLMPGSLVTQKNADGGWVHEPVYGIGKSGKSYLFGENGSEYVMNNRMANNMMLGGRGTQTIRVEVVGKYRGGDIYLANKNAEALLSAIKL